MTKSVYTLRKLVFIAHRAKFHTYANRFFLLLEFEEEFSMDLFPIFIVGIKPCNLEWSGNYIHIKGHVRDNFLRTHIYSKYWHVCHF